MRLSVLWNAEPFGFGPAAAAAALAAALRPDCEQSTYLGDRHTLDLQGADVYDEVIDCAQLEDLDRFLAQAADDYDLLVTAMDFDLARRARQAGLRVVVYDALAWYWPLIDERLSHCDLYLAQDFVGVKRRLAALDAPPPTVVVPPLVSRRRALAPSRGPLVSFGGIANPHWPDDVGDTYVAALGQALAGLGVEAVGARRYQGLVDLPYRCVSPAESERLFAAASVVAATPGLGNVYTAAGADKPFVPLPPVNDSQGRQLRLLEIAGYVPAALDWHHLLDITPIDYLAPQEQVLAQLADCCRRLAIDRKAQARLRSELERRLAAAAADGVCRLRPLLDDYGHDGALVCAEQIRAFAAGEADIAAGVTLARRPSEDELLRFHGYEPQGAWSLEQDESAGPTGQTRAQLVLRRGQETVLAVRRPRRTVARSVSAADVAALRRAGLTHLAHSTRPENLGPLLASGRLLPGERLEAVRYGDPLGPHDRIVGQLAAYRGHEDAEALLALTGGRAPVLLLELESLVGRAAFVNHGYPCAYLVPFATSDGAFTPSLSVSEAAVALADDMQLRRDHELVLVADELPLQLAGLVAYDDQPLPATMRDVPLDVLPAMAIAPFLQQFTPYSANSYAIVQAAFAQGLDERHAAHLLARELPELAALCQAGKLTLSEIANRVLGG